MNKEIYPLTIVYDRYGGAYSGGAYTAWNRDPCDIPEEIYGNDDECFEFWLNLNKEAPIFGIGNSIDTAIEDLSKKLK